MMRFLADPLWWITIAVAGWALTLLFPELLGAKP